ncbi:MAG: GNAT family N-acetyltransferase [Pseudomonadales bacterium]|nr:GNAT family N-acetyltransferase [Pseudomonadales bacterium]
MSHLIEIRRLSDTDANVYSVLRKEANTDKNYRGNRDPENGLTQNEAQRLVVSTNTIVIGAFTNDKLVGMVSLGWMDKKFTLFGLFVSEKYRREGIGEMLTSAIIKQSTDLNAKTIKLEVIRSNKEAISLYEKMGFSYLRRNCSSLKLVLVLKSPSAAA